MKPTKKKVGAQFGNTNRAKYHIPKNITDKMDVYAKKIVGVFSKIPVEKPTIDTAKLRAANKAALKLGTKVALGAALVGLVRNEE
jgi:hypothetical protein